MPIAPTFHQHALSALLAGPDRIQPLPFPGAGQTLQRWQALADVAARDLVLVKLLEAHADALAILHELGAEPPAADTVWAVWAAEPPGARVVIDSADDGPSNGTVTSTGTGPGQQVRLNGSKQWCSGAGMVTHALITAWQADGSGPWLVAVDMAQAAVAQAAVAQAAVAPAGMAQAGIALDAAAWKAVGMAACATADVSFSNVRGRVVGAAGDYVARPGFMHGGAGIAACWYGGALSLARTLRTAVAAAPNDALPFRQAALGRVDVALAQTAALLRDAAAWIDAHPRSDASVHALRVRQSAELCARTVLDEVGRALGATPFCRDAGFARMAADLPVFVRQNLAERDMQALGRRIAAEPQHGWQLLHATPAPPPPTTQP